MASLLALGKSPVRLKSVMWGADFTKFRNVDVANLLGIMNTWGLDDGISLVGEIERLFEIMEPGSKTMKLKDISGLNIVVSDLNLHETVVCNNKTFPELKVVDAIRASMSLPIFFRPFVCPINRHYWVDGAVRAHFPWHVLPDDEARKSALGFSFTKSWEGGPKTFTEYIFSMIHFDEPKTILKMKKHWPKHIIWFQSPPFPAWFVKFKEEDFHLVEEIGERAYAEWITSLGDSKHLPGSSESLLLSAPPCTPAQVSPEDRTVGLLDNPLVCQGPSQDSSRPQLQSTPLLSRRWSF